MTEYHPVTKEEPIELKCWSLSFQAIKNGTKRFEYRKDDRHYDIGVTLWQREWNPDTGYTGEELYHDVTFIIKGGVFGIPEGYCIVSTSEPRLTKEVLSRPDPLALLEAWINHQIEYAEARELSIHPNYPMRATVEMIQRIRENPEAVRQQGVADGWWKE